MDLFDNNSRRRMLIIYAAAIVIFAAVQNIRRRTLRLAYMARRPRLAVDDHRREFIYRLLYDDNHNTHHQLRLNQPTFFKLVEVLKVKGLRSTQNVDVEEQVAIFLYVIGHNVRLRVVAFNFNRSVSTVHRHFTTVLRAITRITHDYVKQPGPNDTLQNSTLYRSFGHHFEDCVGAIDGSYIPAMVAIEDQPRYRTRKGRIAQNVMAAVNFDMKFTYVLAGWEGSARDPKVLRAAVRDVPTKLAIPAGKYYLVDAGYGHYPGFLAPYRGTRYHRSETRGHMPANAHELFNYRHSSLRNVVERAFGLIKKRWAILRTEPFFDIKVQVRVVNVCCILHNFIMTVDPSDLLENESYEEEEPNETLGNENIASLETSNAWTIKRDELATLMWNDYVA